MSNDSPIVNGENTGGVVDFATDASVDMVAEIHDHNRISCGKAVPVEIDQFNSDSKAGILQYSCEFDHMYASLTEGTTLQKDNVEVKHLKELLLLHLDLIQQQSEQLVTKDKQIGVLRQENETLRQRLERMDRRVTLHKHREVLSDVYAPASTTSENIMVQSMSSQYTSPSPSIVLTIPPDEIKQEITAEMLLEDLENMDNTLVNVKQEMLTPTSDILEASTSTTCYGSKRKRKDDDRESDSNSNASRKRKRAVSWTSSAHSDMVSDGRRTPKETKGSVDPPLEDKTTPKKAKVAPSPSPIKLDVFKTKDILTTSDPYYTYIGDADSYWGDEEPELNGHTETEAAVQVPSWRLKSYSSCYTMEGTENLDDEVFNKRHSRLEIDERRRKRWDVQRIREQRQVEKLKQRESSRRSSIATRPRDENESPKVHSFWPHVDDVEYLEIGDTIPVAAFGLPITEFLDSEFSLPWLMYVNSKRKPIITTTTATTTPKSHRRRNRPAVKSRR